MFERKSFVRAQFVARASCGVRKGESQCDEAGEKVAVF